MGEREHSGGKIAARTTEPVSTFARSRSCRNSLRGAWRAATRPASRSFPSSPRRPVSATVQVATAAQYAAWLEGYINHGGWPTNFIRSPFGRDWLYATGGTVTVDSRREYGAQGRRIILASGATGGQTDPHAAFGGWAHTNLYYMDGYRTGHGDGYVPVYTDPEFAVILAAAESSGRGR